MLERKTDSAWERLLADDPRILETIHEQGMAVIQADVIRRYREPRLMTKFDTSANLAQPLKDHRIDVLPDTRRSWVLGAFDLYEPFPDMTGLKPMRISLPDYQTLRVEDLTSEAKAINALLVSGTLEEFLGEENLAATFDGRMGSGDFDFTIKTAGGGLLHIDVRGAQLEIDGGFESDHSVVIMEAKNVLHPDFNVRQLYYPYRRYLGRVTKPIRLVFSQYTNLTYRLHEYRFDDPDCFSSIRRVQTRAFTFEDTAITWTDLRTVWESTKVETDDNQATAPVPFIQADSFDTVISLLERIKDAGGDLPVGDVAELIGYVPRQAAYYPAAGEYLGLFDRSQHGHVKLTNRADKILNLKYRDRQLAYARLMFKHEIFHRLFDIAYRNGRPPEKNDVIAVMAELHVCHEGETMRRRASSVLGWLKWILELPEDDW